MTAVPLVAARIRELLREKALRLRPRARVTFPITGFWNLAPAFTRRTVQIG